MKNYVTTEKAIQLFKNNGGILRTAEALAMGISAKTLYSLRDNGYIQLIDRGIYHLIDDTTDMKYIDLISTVKRLPHGVICLTSALAYHELTTQIPRHVHIGYQQGWREPKVEYPPVKIFRYSKASFIVGIEYHDHNGVVLPIYSPAKTVVDCFKFRNRIGLDVAIEALKDYWHKHKQATADELLEYAKICRVLKTITPYIEAIAHE